MATQRSPDGVARAMLDRVRRYAADAGRDPQDIGFEPRLTLAEVPETDRSEFVTGWRDLGVTHLCVDTMDPELAGVDDHLAVLQATYLALEPLAVDCT